MQVAELADLVGAERRALEALLRRVSSEQWRQPATGTWLAKDVLGHIAAYADAERRALAAGVGRAREEATYFDNIQAWNEQQYELRKKRTPGQIIAEVQENTARYLSLVKSLHEEDLNKTIRFPWGEQGTVHAMVKEGIGHLRSHREQLEQALAR
jgi:hypothetical protein